MEKANFTITKSKHRSQRAEIISEIFDIYTSQRDLRRKENWKRYVAWLKQYHRVTSKESENLFKKTKQYIKEMDIKRFCVLISHIKTDDLYYLLSVAKDMNNRNQPFGAYLISSILDKKLSTVST